MPDGLDVEARRTLDNVSFAVKPGEWVTLLGANGSGKSTLARLANGLLLPTEGEVVAEGISSWQHDKISELRKLVGLVTQDPDNQIVSTTVFDEVAFGPQNLGLEPADIYELVPQMLAKVGFDEEAFAKRDPNSLSGGEKQRVVIAAILAMQPYYLVLDEPTAMLDPLSRAQVLEAIHTASQSGHGVLHITHLLREAAFSDRVLVLDRGRLVYDGAPQGILEDAETLTRYGLKAEPSIRGPLPATVLTEQPVRGAHPATVSEDTAPSDPQLAGAEISHTSNDALEFTSVSFVYPQRPETEPVLEDCNLSLERGECLLLVGASGSGKSTILSLAAGLLQPRTGTVLLGTKAPAPGEVGLVFQQPESQLFAQTVEEDILFGPKNLGLLGGEQQKDELVEQVLNAVGLEPRRFKRRSPYSLSGGEARRVALATTLALQTDFLLLDEPTAGLDARGKVFVYELLQQLMAEGKGIIIATHDPEYFADLASGRVELS